MPISRRQFLQDAIAAASFAGGLDATLLQPGETEGEHTRASTALAGQAQITVDSLNVKHTMAGGIGASWHAIGPTAFWYDNLRGRLNRSCRGSVWGGNPPLEFAEAWSDIRRHAQWFGFNFVRVEIDMRMYNPGPGLFDWENDEMQTLYRSLEYCQANGVDVFFTQMWQDVQWNSFDGVSRLQSAPKSVPEFVRSVSSLMDHLVLQEKFTCIRWLCISNEPGLALTWWLGPEGAPVSLMPALTQLRRELDRRGIFVILSGPDWSSLTQSTPDFEMDSSVVGAHDQHNYASEAQTDLQMAAATKAHSKGMPFFQSEFGTMNGESPFTHPTSTSPRDYGNQLVNAEKVIGGINVGVDGFNRWSFLNRGDLDGQWQLVRTWDPVQWEYYKNVVPEPVPYLCYGILTRFLAKYSAVLHSSVSDNGIVSVALRSPRSNLSIYVLNKADHAKPILLTLDGIAKELTLQKYQVTESTAVPGGRIDPLGTFRVSDAALTISDTIPGASITVYSTYKLRHEDPGIISD